MVTETKDLETKIIELDSVLPELNNFILPGGTTEASKVHRVRVLCRKLERAVVRHCIRPENEDSKYLIPYLNRLSDFMFSLARYMNFTQGVPDTIWLDRSK